MEYMQILSSSFLLFAKRSVQKRSLALRAIIVIIVHNRPEFTQIAVKQIISHDSQFTEMFRPHQVHTHTPLICCRYHYDVREYCKRKPVVMRITRCFQECIKIVDLCNFTFFASFARLSNDLISFSYSLMLHFLSSSLFAKKNFFYDFSHAKCHL